MTKKMIPTAECRFCGQLVQLDGDCELTPEQAEEKAVMVSEKKAAERKSIEEHFHAVRGGCGAGKEDAGKSY